MFHNVEGLAKHFQCTFADEAFTGADILLFVETHGEADTQYDLDTFGLRELVRLTKTNRLRPRGGLGHNQSGSGSLIAVRQELFDECRANVNEVVIAVTPNRRVEMTTCTVRGITIVSVYKSPSVNQQELINALRGGLTILHLKSFSLLAILKVTCLVSVIPFDSLRKNYIFLWDKTWHDRYHHRWRHSE
jgi:hypothetical protein